MGVQRGMEIKTRKTNDSGIDVQSSLRGQGLWALDHSAHWACKRPSPLTGLSPYIPTAAIWSRDGTLPW